ncbi:MAG: helix-turn-helix domain-containing protein [Muribaculaceae bacterium]|nr:helix-turn-helix domain-containing protein [Muribaculaceae bacterium]
MEATFNYKLNLPESLDEILEQDFWVVDNVRPLMFRYLTEPVKFAANTWIFVKKGSCNAEISLIPYQVKGPAFVQIKSSQFMLPSSISDDFEAAVIVMSKRFEETLFLMMADTSLQSLMARKVWVTLPEEVAGKVNEFISTLQQIISDKENPYGKKALLYYSGSFIFRDLYRAFEPFKEEAQTTQGRIAAHFMALVQEHYKKERFLDFYASKLDITPKHLSRTVKEQTGYSAVDWIERFVILEAKVYLKSTNLNIQQIADEMNFPSQSFFGKYFKKYTGMSPKEFRNS